MSINAQHNNNNNRKSANVCLPLRIWWTRCTVNDCSWQAASVWLNADKNVGMHVCVHLQVVKRYEVVAAQIRRLWFLTIFLLTFCLADE